MNANPPKRSSTFLEYCSKMSEKVLMVCQGAKRIDMCFDIYKQDSLKLQTRENRGTEIRTIVHENTQIPTDFKSFMRIDDNKTKLFGMFATNLVGKQSTIQLITTLKDQVLANVASIDTRQISECNHEEADTRVILHVFDGASKGINKIKINTIDTDVMVIALYHFFSLSIKAASDQMAPRTDPD